MIGRALALGLALIALCGARPAPQFFRVCQLERTDEGGTILLHRRMDHVDPVTIIMYWYRRPFQLQGMNIHLFWPGISDPTMPPNDQANVIFSFAGIRLATQPDARVELRRLATPDETGKDALIGEWTRRGDQLMLTAQLGILRAFATPPGPIAAVVVDRTGQTLSQAPFDLAMLEPASAAAIAAVPEWQAMTGDPEHSCRLTEEPG
jgi:hypothetical protein